MKIVVPHASKLLLMIKPGYNHIMYRCYLCRYITGVVKDLFVKKQQNNDIMTVFCLN